MISKIEQIEKAGERNQFSQKIFDGVLSARRELNFLHEKAKQEKPENRKEFYLRKISLLEEAMLAGDATSIVNIAKDYENGLLGELFTIKGKPTDSSQAAVLKKQDIALKHYKYALIAATQVDKSYNPYLQERNKEAAETASHALVRIALDEMEKAKAKSLSKHRLRSSDGKKEMMVTSDVPHSELGETAVAIFCQYLQSVKHISMLMELANAGYRQAIQVSENLQAWQQVRGRICVSRNDEIFQYELLASRGDYNVLCKLVAWHEQHKTKGSSLRIEQLESCISNLKQLLKEQSSNSPLSEQLVDAENELQRVKSVMTPVSSTAKLKKAFSPNPSTNFTPSAPTQEEIDNMTAQSASTTQTAPIYPQLENKDGSSQAFLLLSRFS